ncbi:hypothetical protein LCGC14_0815340 [marine sediment metagenome]|uniref:Uncharacterized protein n=1 Tax=marine sediment metagenome TaxID=412755 RepID=A0A0F9Q5T8_9ZZZZ
MTAPYEKASGQYTDTFAFEALAVVGSATAFTAGTYDPVGVESNTPAISATVQCQVAQVRYRVDGTDPTASVGTLMDVGDEIVVWGSRDIKSFRAIRTGGVSATLATHYAR